MATNLEKEKIRPEQHFAMDVGKEKIIINVGAQNIISMLKWMKKNWAFMKARTRSCVNVLTHNAKDYRV